MGLKYVLGRQGKFFVGLDYPSAVVQTKIIDCTVTIDTQTTDVTTRDDGSLTVNAPTRLEGSITANFKADPSDATYLAFIQNCRQAMENCTPVFVNPALPVAGHQAPGMYTVTSIKENLPENEPAKVEMEFKMYEYQPEFQFAFGSTAAACDAPDVSAGTPGATSCELTWSAVTGAGGYAIYNTEHELVQMVGASATLTTLTGLTPSTSYTFYVYTVGNASTTNVSATGDTVTFTTAAAS